MDGGAALERMRRWVACAGVGVALAGCADKVASDSASGSGPGGAGQDSGPVETVDDTDTDTDTDTEERLEVPVVEAVDAACATRSSGDTRMVWTVLAQASDPQGADTLETLVPEGVVVSLGDTEAGRYDLSCRADDLSSATCTATFSGDTAGLGCEGAAAVTVVVEVVDEDGNRGASDPTAGRAE